jgi:hypothetical protein
METSGTCCQQACVNGQGLGLAQCLPISSVGSGFQSGCSELLQSLGYFWQEAIDLCGDVCDRKEVSQVWEDAGLSVDVHQLGCTDGQTDSSSRRIFAQAISQ